MTSRCCWLIQPARATRTNCSGCDSDGTAASLSDAEYFEALDRRSEVDRVFGRYEVAIKSTWGWTDWTNYAAGSDVNFAYPDSLVGAAHHWWRPLRRSFSRTLPRPRGGARILCHCRWPLQWRGATLTPWRGITGTVYSCFGARTGRLGRLSTGLPSRRRGRVLSLAARGQCASATDELRASNFRTR